MKTIEEIEQLTNQTLDSLNGIKPIEANHFLFDKIRNRMKVESQQQIERIKTLSRLSAALILFIGLNVSSYYFLSGNGPKQTIPQKPNAAEALAAEYHLTGGTYNY